MPYTPSSPRIAYHLHSDQGAPTLLIVGFAMTSRMWSALTPHLTPHLRVATFDNRGVGQSEVPGRTWSMADMADDAARVLDALGWEQAHIVGVSMGGMIAQHLALNHRPRLRSLTLIATQPGGRRAILPRVTGVGAFLRANLGPTAQRLQALKSLLYPPDFVAAAPPAFDIALLEALGEPPPARVRQAQLRAILSHDARPHLHRLEGLPTLIVRPDRDVLIRPTYSDLLLQLIPGARLVPIPHGGHGLIRQDPALLASLLIDHIQRAEPD